MFNRLRFSSLLVAVLLLLVAIPAEGRPVCQHPSKCRTTSSQSSSASSRPATTVRRTSKPTRRVAPPKRILPSISVPKHDSSEYNNLTAIRDTMIEILTEMQSVNIRAYYVYFGDTRDVRRLEAIPDEYAKTVNRLTAYVDSARRLPLIARERAETDKLVDYAQSLADEFTKLRKHFKCVVENTCSLLEQ